MLCSPAPPAPPTPPAPPARSPPATPSVPFSCAWAADVGAEDGMEWAFERDLQCALLDHGGSCVETGGEATAVAGPEGHARALSGATADVQEGVPISGAPQTMARPASKKRSALALAAPVPAAAVDIRRAGAQQRKTARYEKKTLTQTCNRVLCFASRCLMLLPSCLSTLMR